MEDNDGGWIVILRRKTDVSQRVNFRRTWDEYVHGFGDLNTEFWYGLRNIHCLTTRQQIDLQLVLNYTNGTSHRWIYHQFVVDRPEDKYTLHIGEAEGPNALDSMAYNNGYPFSTYDNDNDHSSGSCSQSRQGGGWWYNSCNYCELTRPHPQIWRSLYLDYAEMKVRSKQCNS